MTWTSCGTTTIQAGFDNAGTIDAQAGLIDFLGISPLEPTLEAGSHITGAGTVAFEEVVTRGSGSAHIDAGATVRLDSFLYGNGDSDLRVAGTLDWSNGAIQAGTAVGLLKPTTTIAAGGSLNITGTVTLNGDRDIVNNGTTTWSAGSDLNLFGNGDFRNAATFQHTDSLSGTIWGTSFNNPAFMNLAGGTFKKTNLGGTTTIQAGFDNAGTLEIAAGTVDVTGQFSNYNGTTGTLTGGTYLVAGTLRFTGADIATNAATIVLDGTTSAITDELAVDGGTEGSKGVTITGTGGNAALAGVPTWTSDPIAVAPGELLDLRVLVSAEGMSSAPSVGLAYLGKAGKLLDTVRLLEVPLVTDGFATLEQSVTLPQGVTQVRIVLFGFSATDLSTAGTVIFDDVGLYGP